MDRHAIESLNRQAADLVRWRSRSIRDRPAPDAAGVGAVVGLIFAFLDRAVAVSVEPDPFALFRLMWRIGAISFDVAFAEEAQGMAISPSVCGLKR